MPNAPSWSADPPFSIRLAHALHAGEQEQLAALLVDAVRAGASVGFMWPLEASRAAGYWRAVADGLATGARALLLAHDALGICGTVQLALDTPPNQPHRAEVCKLLVHTRARRRGLGAALMARAEVLAREHGRTLLVLDTHSQSDAANLYARLGWQPAGHIPGYALLPDGTPSATTYFYKTLAPAV